MRRALIACAVAVRIAAADAPTPAAAGDAPAPAAGAAQPAAPAADASTLPPLTLAERLRLEAHGFVSFGYLRTWRDAWLGDTIDGTTRFQEAALNVIARPMNRVRIGAQLFERDLGEFDNGRVELDWAYAEYRFSDHEGVAVGRVKIPFGLYNETLDVDSAHTPIFLPQMYGLRARDLFLTVDGGKAFGCAHLGAAGDVDLVGYGGDKHLDRDSGTLQYLGDLGFGQDLAASVGWAAGGMAHWTTPVPGLGLRFSWAHLEDLRLDGDGPGGTRLETRLDYDDVCGSIIWESRPVTLAAELAAVRGRGVTVVEPIDARVDVHDNGRDGYVSATWHLRPWLDWYVAGDAAFQRGTRSPHSLRAVTAFAVRPTQHLTLKTEFQQVDGTLDYQHEFTPHPHRSWQVLALKATVDF